MTSTMTATHYPSSATLSIPTTQNTAPVVSFNCLYTHDLRRKAKRWQDGVLRFHTFNKRAMVYDTSMNFIGDTHRQESQVLQDGDDLELEKGVLIQVGEEIGRTESDLRELLDKSKKPKPVLDGNEEVGGREKNTEQATPTLQVVKPRHDEVERPTASVLAQLRPKSLNVLLGKPRGPVGRAALPTKSPAELRREKNVEPVPDGRSPKRRRIEYSTNSSPSVISAGARERRRDAQRVSTTSSKVTEPTDIRKPTMAPRRIEEKAHPRVIRDRSSLSPEAHSRKPCRSEQRNCSSLSDNRQNLNTLKAGHLASKQSTIGQERVGHPRSNPAHRADDDREKLDAEQMTAINGLSHERGKAEEISNEDANPQELTVVDEPRPQHLLRIASRKPRKKLMYRELLPRKAPPLHDLNTVAQPQRADSDHSKISHKTGEKPPQSSLNDFHDAQQDRLQARLRKRTNSTGTSIEQNTDNMEDAVRPEKAPPISNFDSTFPDSLFLTQSSSSEFQELPTPNKLRPPDPVPTSTQAARTLTKLDAPLLQKPIKPTAAQPHPNPIHETIKAALPPNHQSRPFQRSISDLSSKPPLTNHPIKRTDTKLQKSLSDTAPPNPQPIPQTRTAMLYRSDSDAAKSAAQEAVVDPWSKEAWDLFGYEGGDKRITTENGIKKEWHGG